ncbi:MAG: hypothetical protein V1721_10315 [Pseudomonadota bacterium]
MAREQVLQQVKEKKSRRVQKTIRFDPDVWEALEAHMKRQRVDNISIAVSDAVKYSLFPEHRSDREADLVKLYHQLSFSLAEHRKKTARDMTFLQEMLFQYIHHYFMHTHQIPAAEQGAAEAQANVRLDAFMEQLVAKLPQKKSSVTPE